MKKKTFTTTEFYRNPHKALNFVKDGGIVYLGYKNLKEPIAVLTDFATYKKKPMITKKAKSIKKNEPQTLWDLVKDKVISSKKPIDSTKLIRKQRDAK